MGRLHRLRRCLAVSAVALGATGVLAVATPAGASGGTVTCTEVSGNDVSASLVFGCSQTEETNGSGSIPRPVPFFSGTKTGVIYWSVESGGASQTEIHIHTRVIHRKKTPCPAGTTELKVTGRVRADTTGVITVGGRVSATLCQEPSGGFSLLSNTVLFLG
ncbi:MAG TPA: hypothetical protein VMF60_08615 [Acidimicrobiales bacterium]|nr:hypothetical protein [Acidimicrobiales bacterium]